MISPRLLKTPCRLIVAIAALASSVLACGGEHGTSGEATGIEQSLEGIEIDPRIFKSPSWIDAYDPDSSAAGYNLVLYKRRMPMIIDMDGKVVHVWPDVRTVGRARLLSSGHLAVIEESGSLEEFDWEGRQTWSFTLPDPKTFLHHDFIKLENGNYLLLGFDPSMEADFLLEVDRSGEVLWRWNATEHLEEDFYRSDTPDNKTHINSVHELPSNRWFDQSHEAFRPGNILISARNLNALYVISRPSGDVVWQYYENLDYQHEAIMIPPGIQGAGNLLVFNNGYHDLAAYRQSSIVEIDPVANKKVWEFRKRGFYSSTGGTQQSLPNGNLLVTSSQGGRVFELTRDGRIVWQWSPPYLPMRIARYPADHCRQLAELGPPSKEPIERSDPHLFVDKNLYTFSLSHETTRLRIEGRSRYLVENPNRCQVLQIPQGVDLILGFGARIGDHITPFVSDVGGAARFTATLRPVDSADAEGILDRTLTRADLKPKGSEETVSLLHEKISLRPYESQRVELCLGLASNEGGPIPGDFVWAEPLIRSPNRRAARLADEEVDAEALKRQEKHLKAIGYLN